MTHQYPIYIIIFGQIMCLKLARNPLTRVPFIRCKLASHQYFIGQAHGKSLHNDKTLDLFIMMTTRMKYGKMYEMS